VLFVASLSDRFHGLRDIELFANCTGRDLRRIDSMTTRVKIEAGHVLCRQGEVGRECFVILTGEADVSVGGHHRTVGRGALLGEIALLTPNGRRTATVTALSELSVLVLSRTEFAQVMAGIPVVAHAILREATRRLLENTDGPDAGGAGQAGRT